jgi:hypothetical protein
MENHAGEVQMRCRGHGTVRVRAKCPARRRRVSAFKRPLSHFVSAARLVASPALPVHQSVGDYHRQFNESSMPARSVHTTFPLLDDGMRIEGNRRHPSSFSSVSNKRAVERQHKNLCRRILTNRSLSFQTEFPQSGPIFPGFPQKYPSFVRGFTNRL